MQTEKAGRAVRFDKELQCISLLWTFIMHLLSFLKDFFFSSRLLLFPLAHESL